LVALPNGAFFLFIGSDVVLEVPLHVFPSFYFDICSAHEILLGD